MVKVKTRAPWEVKTTVLRAFSAWYASFRDPQGYVAEPHMLGLPRYGCGVVWYFIRRVVIKSSEGHLVQLEDYCIDEISNGDKLAFRLCVSLHVESRQRSTAIAGCTNRQYLLTEEYLYSVYTDAVLTCI